MKAVDHRKKIYAMFESLIGRKMTDKEHTMLKDAMLEYLGDEVESAKALNGRLENRLRVVREHWDKMLVKNAVPADVIQDLLLQISKV